MTIHWCGTGLSSGPGLRRLIEAGHPVVVWNRTVANARDAVGDVAKDIRAYSLDALTAALQPGDVAVSMLPADQHVSIAKACLDKGAHFVSSSYIAPEMRALDAEFSAVCDKVSALRKLYTLARDAGAVGAERAVGAAAAAKPES